MLQFYKSDPKDYIDIFLDTFEMDHNIDLKKRLNIDRYTISLSDILLTKIQIHKINEKDVRDILTLLKDKPLGYEDKPGIINIKYIAKLCAKDWGLYKDVTTNIEKCLKLMNRFTITKEEGERSELPHAYAWSFLL
ncbi:MAG: hypothetical protein ACTSYQ_04760 [Candidatus Odinarchaeia archaeon]